MHAFYSELLQWLRSGIHEESGNALKLAECVENFLERPRGDEWDIIQKKTWHDNEMVFIEWIEKNEDSGTYCSPPWGRGFTSNVRRHLTKYGDNAFRHPIKR